MPRQATRPVDKLRGPVRKAALAGLDRTSLQDDPLLTGLSELQTKQALKVLDTYCANVQRQGSGRIQNKAAYLMSLIQSYKLGPAPGATAGSAQRLLERLSPPVSQAVQGVFDPVLDRCVYEDRALMELLAKVPEEQALAALKKYRATVQRRGRDAIENRCGYLIGFLKQYQDGVAIVGVPGNAMHQARNALESSSNGYGQHLTNGSAGQSSSSATNGHNPNANGARNGAMNGAAGGPSATATSSSQGTGAAGNGGPGGGGNSSGVRPITYLQAPVRKELEKLFESGKDKTVLEDVGLIKQLSRLGEEQALAALKNYKEASKHRRDIHNKSAYLMGILRGYIEGTTPISKAPWEGGGNEDGSGVNAPTAPPGSNRARGRGRGAGQVDVERSDPNPLPQSNVPSPAPAPAPAAAAAPTQPQPQPQSQSQPQPQPQSPATPPAAPSAAPAVVVSAPPRELGGFANAPAQTQQQQLTQPPPSSSPSPPVVHPAAPLTSISATPSASPPLGGDRRFLASLRHDGASGGSSQGQYEPSNGLLYMNGSGTHHQQQQQQQQPLRHVSPHESLFGGGHLSANHHGGQPQTLVGPGLLGGDFLASGGGADWTGGAPLSGTAHGGGSESLFGSGLLAGENFGSCNNSSSNLGNAVPQSPGSGSGSGLGSTSGVGSSFLSVPDSGVESPLSSDAGNDTPGTLPSSTTTATVSAGSLSVAGSSSCNGSTDYASSGSPESGQGRENTDSSNGNGVVDVLARLNLSKYVAVLAEAEVDLDALRLFGEDDLKDLGFPKGPRIKLLHEVQNLNFPPRA
ncbi:similar to Ddhd2 protein [Ectocarpus siliculosus]|uniref:Similar to Ddhd2 protein n=1 Tax=Ectocarpus siliculosus TaxID=2880 RepID=D7FLD5_ECTSI|nr:similar to Ddhd2 protein [Ectocarpus siliculosus]|eukprot:CBJ29703.1 similar to Ddhd2 protein [Ectocarpus siliculosus]